MKVKVNTKIFNDVLSNIKNAVQPTKSSLPILKGVCISTVQQGLMLVASNTNVTLAQGIPFQNDKGVLLEVEQEGSIVLPFSTLFEACKNAKLEKIEISVDQNLLAKVQINKKTTVDIGGQDAKEFPKLPEINQESIFNIKSDLFKKLIEQTVFAASTSDTRPILQGVKLYYNTDHQQLELVATDSHRLAYRKCSLENNNLNLKAVVPAETLIAIKKVLPPENVDVTIALGGTQIACDLGNCIFYGRLLDDGAYPRIDHLISNIPSNTELIIDKKAFLESLGTCSIYSEKNKAPLMEYSGKEIHLSMVEYGGPGRVDEYIAVEGKGSPIKIKFNMDYLEDAIKSLDGDKFLMRLSSSSSPIYIMEINSNDMIHLVLPIR